MGRLAPRQQPRNKPHGCGNDRRCNNGKRCFTRVIAEVRELLSLSSLSASANHYVSLVLIFFLTIPINPHVTAQSGRGRNGAANQTRVPVERSRPKKDLPPQPVVAATPKEQPAPLPPVSGTLPPSSAAAEPVADVVAGDDEVIDVRSNLVPVATSVIDARGLPLLNLIANDFELFVDGKLKPIAEVSRSETPVRLAMLFDNSASLTRTRELEKEAAMRFFSRVMRPIDQAAIFSVTHNVQLEQHLTNNVAGLIRTIKRFGDPEGATSLLDAVADAAAYLKPQPGRKVIVIVSDGVDTTSRSDFATAMRAAQAADCQIYAVQTGHDMNANLRDLAAERRLHEFAAQTGGAVYTPTTYDDLDRAFSQVAADLAQQYILSYYPSDEPADGRFRRFTVRVLNKQNVRVRNRSGYYAPKG
jgi:Ca-activated chloride channel family protein